MLSDRQLQIINESIKLIDSKGIQGFTIKNLSKEVGISEPGIYRHFENKFAILAAILDLFKKNIFEKQVVSASKSNDPTEKLRMFSDKIFEVFTQNPALITVIFSEEIYQNEKELSYKVNEIQTFNENLITSFLIELRQDKKLPDHVNIDSFILMFFGSIRLLARKWKISDYSFDLNTKGNDLVNSLIDSIKYNYEYETGKSSIA
jgi:AcrR family transcriptional regulator